MSSSVLVRYVAFEIILRSAGPGRPMISAPARWSRRHSVERRGEDGEGEAAEEGATVDHSMMWSTRAAIDGGNVRPSALAARMFTTNSNFVGCSTGRSAGLAPFRILST